MSRTAHDQVPRPVKVHLWGELGFYGPDRRGEFEVPLEEPMPLVEALG